MKIKSHINQNDNKIVKQDLNNILFQILMHFIKKESLEMTLHSKCKKLEITRNLNKKKVQELMMKPIL